MSGMRRRGFAVLVVPILLALSACRIETGFEILNADEFRYTYDLSVPADSEENLTPEEICESLVQSEGDRVEAEAYADENIGCRLTMVLAINDTDGMISLADDVWTFTIAPEMLEDQRGQMEQLDEVVVSVTFPAEVISHSGSSTLDGTTVTWTDIDEIFGEEGLSATARDVEGGSAPGSILPTDPGLDTATPTAQPTESAPTETAVPTATATPTADPTSTPTGINGRDATRDDVGEPGSGFPWWGWVIGAVVAVLGITGFSLRGKKKPAEGETAGSGS